MKKLFFLLTIILLSVNTIFSQRVFHNDVIIDSTKTLTVGSYWNPSGTTGVVSAPSFSSSWYANPTYPELNTRQGAFSGPGLNNYLGFNESIYPGGQNGLVNSSQWQSGSSAISLISQYNQKQINFSVGAGPQWTLDQTSIHSQDSTSKIGEGWAPLGEVTSKVFSLVESYPSDTSNYKYTGFIRVGNNLYWGNGTYYKKIN